MTSRYLSSVKDHRDKPSNAVHGDIRSAGNDLHHAVLIHAVSLSSANIYPADHKLISIRMLFNMFYPSDIYTFKVFIQPLKALHLCSGESHSVCILLISALKLRNIISNPRKRCIHKPSKSSELL